MECIDENKFLLYERNNYKIAISSDANVIQKMMIQIRQVLRNNGENRYSTNKLSVGSIGSESNKSELSNECLNQSASSETLNFLNDNSVDSVDNRISLSDGSSIESGKYGGSRSDEYNEKQQLRQMIQNFDRFYEIATNKIPSSTVPPEAIDSFTVGQSSAEIIQEMLTNEIDYVRQLTIGIETYLMCEYVGIVKIFGNIQQIRNFHEHTFSATLSDCNNDVTKIANVFIKFTQEGLFSNYLMYAINRGNTLSLCCTRPYRDLFELRQKDVLSSQGIEYYLHLPFQHCSKYQSFMDRIINTLNIDNDTVAMASCSKAIKNIERLLKDTNSSRTTSNEQTKKRRIRKMSNLFLNGIQNMRKH